jgi:hypothetical protein
MPEFGIKLLPSLDLTIYVVLGVFFSMFVRQQGKKGPVKPTPRVFGVIGAVLLPMVELLAGPWL